MMNCRQPRRIILSADLGQANDRTALSTIVIDDVIADADIVVSETGTGRSKYEAPSGELVTRRMQEQLNVLHLQRLELHTTYPQQIRIISEIFRALPPAQEPPQLVVDFTGVGRPVVQAMREAGLEPIGITITAGHDENRVSRFEYRVPKRNLVANLAVALESGRLKIAPELPEAEALVNELVNFKMKISAAGHDTYAAWRDSIHDDLVLSVAIGLFVATRKQKAMRVTPGSSWMER